MTYIPEPRIKFADSAGLDAFGRQRVSKPTTVFDSKQLFDKAPLLWAEKLTAGGTATHEISRAATEMAVTTTGDIAIRQTKQRFAYQPGRSLLLLCTGVLATSTVATGATSRLGYFDGYNGAYFELADTTMNVVLRKGGVETRVAQSSWNIDVMDGYGASGITLDPTKTQIFAIDFQWLGVGRVRMCLDMGGVLTPVHEFVHSNILEEVYINNPNLPVRYEIESTGGARSMDHICAAVTVEGDVKPAGLVHSIDRGTTSTATVSAGILIPILSVRLKSTHLNAVVLPIGLEVASLTGDDIRYSLLVNPTLDGYETASWESLDNSAIEYDVSRQTLNVVSGGTQVASGYILGSQQAAGAVPKTLNFQLRLGSDIDGVRDEFVLAAEIFSGSGTIIGGLTFRELL